MNQAERKVFLVQQLRSLFKDVEASMTEENYEDVAEYIEVEEFRLAFDLIFAVIVHDEIPIDEESFERLVLLAESFGLEGMAELRHDLLGRG